MDIGPSQGRCSIIVARESGSAPAVIAVDGQQCGHHFAGDKPVLVGEFVDDVETSGDVVGGINDDRRDGNAAFKVKQLVTVRLMVAVESPNAAQHSGPAGVLRLPQAADKCAVHGHAVVAVRFGGVDHDFLPHRQAVFVDTGKTVGALETLAVAFANPKPLDGDQRSSQQCAEFGQDAGIWLAASTAMIITGTSTLRLKNRARSRWPWTVPSTPRKTEAPARPRRYSRSTTA